MAFRHSYTPFINIPVQIPCPEHAMSILVGTASWTDRTLLACGRFYPHEARTAQARLRYYATQFPIAEADSGFYAIPSASTTQAWVERTPPHFVFNVKAFRLFTGHQTPVAALDADLRRELAYDGADDGARDVLFADQLPREIHDEAWRRFILALEPLRMSGKLGTVHFQFPPWVRPDRRGRARVADCVARLEDHVPSLEFRHRSWFEGAAAQDTPAWLRELGAVHTIVDAPQGFDNTVPAVWDATRDDIALVRMHGRNTATWNSNGSASSSRFTYEYSQAELDELARRVRALAQRVRETHVILNTNFEDQGMRNAQGLMTALAALDRP
jgi:uncharacterized protein YecE (DUF72 family)